MLPDLDTTTLVILAAFWGLPAAVGGAIAWWDLLHPLMPQAGTRRAPQVLVDNSLVLPPVWHDVDHPAAPWWAGAALMPEWAEDVGHGWHDAARRASATLDAALDDVERDEGVRGRRRSAA